jgi:hypothetical protein
MVGGSAFGEIGYAHAVLELVFQNNTSVEEGRLARA